MQAMSRLRRVCLVSVFLTYVSGISMLQRFPRLRAQSQLGLALTLTFAAQLSHVTRNT
jgi:hypothetical protein